MINLDYKNQNNNYYAHAINILMQINTTPSILYGMLLHQNHVKTYNLNHS